MARILGDRKICGNSGRQRRTEPHRVVFPWKIEPRPCVYSLTPPEQLEIQIPELEHRRELHEIRRRVVESEFDSVQRDHVTGHDPDIAQLEFAELGKELQVFLEA